ncbi:efflux RND transporter periplasmic adaptor subunit [Tunturiibacter gelidoferens]|uniref:RND family efflux transporter MFP subunit n=1 Tax=Tunturiibacter gelidiferens TaxID=3069689 RepID=A0A9X0U3F9_9BACT|nr:efflux RND transporter periplasmic adaptor subunit [Edaphobacter lichenicola]MBB5326767.1 RND family efflux transporter MFP subunit [Edaphobacter lichenicola]
MTIENDPSEVVQANAELLTTPSLKMVSGPMLAGLSVAALVVGAIIYGGIHARAQAETDLGLRTEHASVPTVNVVRPKSGAMSQEIVLPGNTQAYNDTPIYARTNGYLTHWYVDIGTHVMQGQLLAEIDTPEINRQLEQARADLKNAEANEQLAEITAERWKNLLKTSSVSKQETDQAISDLSARQAAVDSKIADVHRLEELQSFEKVYAPFSGVITARNTDIGALINAGAGGVPQELFHMAAVDRLRVYVAVPEVDSLAAQVGAKATLALDEFPDEIFEGKIVRDSHSIDSASRTLNVEVDVENAKERIKTGAYVFVHLKIPRQTETSVQSLTIPANTLLFRSEGLRVGVVRNNRVALTPIKIGRDFGATVEVVSGLLPTDNVILNPSDSLSGGREVQIGRPQVGGSK